MKLATKLAGAVVLIMIAVFATRAYETAQREIARGRADLREAQFITGRALRPAIREVWRLEGRQRALEVLNYADERIRRAREVRIAWVSLDPPSPAFSEQIGPSDLATMRADEDATVVRVVQGRLFTYIPLQVGERVVGALQISEPLASYEQRWRGEVMAVLARAGLGAAVSILAVSALGFMMVGRPVGRLTEMAKRIGAGDLDGAVEIRQNDEIGELAYEMNQMRGSLRAANQRVQEETSARIAALDQLRHVDRLKTVGTLASGIAHELGTPLNVVSGRAKMIATGEVIDGSAADSARIIVEQVDRIAKIIRQLLDFARRRALERGRHRLGVVVEQTLHLLRPMAQKRAVALHLAPGGTELEAEIDSGQIQQALANLVVNGIQAMTGGGELKVEIVEVRARRPAEGPGDLEGPLADYARIVVVDQGRGIAPDLIGRVFEPFFTTKDIGEGTGLGLSVTHGIVRDHGGFIVVESEVGRGSRFAIHLPLRQEVST